MKLSELSTERAMDVLCILTEPVSAIVSDEMILQELRDAVDKENAVTMAEKISIGLQKLGRLMPMVLKDHRQDVYTILSVMNEKSAEEIAKQNVLATMKQIRDIIKDKELLDFFRSCADSQGSE